MLNRIRELAKSASEDAPPDFGVSAPSAGPGTYVGWYVAPECAAQIQSWCRSHGFNNCLEADDFHTTIIYSPTKGLPATKNGTRPLRPVRVLTPAVHRTVERFGPGHQALVVRFAEFTDAYLRHESFLAQGLVHAHPDVATHFHLTLCYDAGAVDPHVMADLARNPLPFPIVYDREKIESITDDSYA